jgi:hypothetical protein
MVKGIRAANVLGAGLRRTVEEWPSRQDGIIFFDIFFDDCPPRESRLSVCDLATEK